MSDLTKLAKKTALEPWWRWYRGMICLPDEHGCVVTITTNPGEPLRWVQIGGPKVRGRIDRKIHRKDLVPDLSDPATLGVLECVLRKAYSGALVVSIGNGWWSVETDNATWDHDDTSCYQEALICALEAAQGGG